MLFNSPQFIFFFIITYGLYLCLNHKRQNRLLLLTSYLFYASWDWRFLSLIFSSTVVDFFCGLKIHESKEQRQRKFFLILSVVFNLTVLGFFKYFNFFTENFRALFQLFGASVQERYLNIILPIGISFYTFQTMSYTIDIFRKEMKPTRKFLDFALFVSFFPQLVAGPIERAKQLLPQMLSPRIITAKHFYEGSYLIFWGLFQKVFIADNLANLVNPVFASAPPYNGFQVLLASYAFTFQIFCDFAGYSNVARGLGKMMGFDIMINFNLPFLVTNIQDFWNKWHISLSSWIRDYLYFPLFRWLRFIKGNYRIFAALMISMVLIGLWHGASWNFVLFGVYYGFMLIFYVIIRTKYAALINPQRPFTRKLWLVTRYIFMFHVIVVGMLIFRVEYVHQIGYMLQSVLINFGRFDGMLSMIIKMVFYTWILLAVKWAQFKAQDLMVLYESNVAVKTACYFLFLTLMVMYGATSGEEFIYFQF